MEIPINEETEESESGRDEGQDVQALSGEIPMYHDIEEAVHKV